jgi:hypothetical protein
MNTSNEMTQRIVDGAKVAVASALEEHRRMGRSVVIERDGKIVVLKPEEIKTQQEIHVNDCP